MENNKDVKVSIVIPVYNVESYLRGCMDSVLGQTLSEIEVICVDDRSEDRCPEILDDYAQKDSRVVVIHLQENRMQGFARNRGAEIASGKYLYFLDSDDLIEQNAMEELYLYAEKENLDAVFFDSRVIFENDQLAKKQASYPAFRSGVYDKHIYKGYELFCAFMEQQEWNCYIQRMFWKRDYLVEKQIRFPEGYEHEDEVFAFEGIFAASRVRYWNRPFYIRRVRENSVVTKPPAPRNFYGYSRCFLEMTAYLLKQKSILAPSERTLRAADANIGRIFCKLSSYYDLMSETNDLASWFQTEEERKWFHLFEQAKKADTYPRFFTNNLISKISQYERIFIYGAGMIAKTVWNGCSKQGMTIEGFFVTSLSGNPATLFGRRVQEIKAYKGNRDNSIIIIAVTKGYQQEIMEQLDHLGWKYVCFDDRS